MVGRCLHALAYVLTFPAAALLVNFIFVELEERGWRHVLPAGLLVGGLALILEERQFRSRWPSPKTRSRFLVQSVALHTIYLALAVGLSIMFDSSLSDNRLMAALLGLVMVPPLLVLTLPVGIVLGVTNAFVLWTRAGHLLGSAMLVGLLALPVFGAPIDSWHTKIRTFGWVQRSLNEIPSPPGSARDSKPATVDQKYAGVDTPLVALSVRSPLLVLPTSPRVRSHWASSR